MKLMCLMTVALLASQAASAADASKTQNIPGNGALAFAALVAEHSPLLTAKEKRMLADFLVGQSKVKLPAGQKITVTADSVICRASDVDFTEHACDLIFGKKTAQLDGGRAHELYATLVEIGAPSEGAAGTIFEALSNLSCMIDPKEIESKDGGGADCRFTPGGP